MTTVTAPHVAHFKFNARGLEVPPDLEQPYIAVTTLDDRIPCFNGTGRQFLEGEWPLMTDLLAEADWAGIFVSDENVDLRRQPWSRDRMLEVASCRAVLNAGGSVFGAAVFGVRVPYWLSVLTRHCHGQLWAVDVTGEARMLRPADGVPARAA